VHIGRILRSIIKDLSMRTGLYQRMLFGHYPFGYEPSQLMVLAEALKQTPTVPGCIIEAGCAGGATTVFLNRFMDEIGLDRPYYAVDTFSGFTAPHVAHEITARHKPAHLREAFVENRREWFETSMRVNGIKRVRSVKCDITAFDFIAVAPVAFCLIDVDLYLPTKEALSKVMAAMSPGGIIVVDDCQPHELWDGALQAYMEFTFENGIVPEIQARKLGIIQIDSISRTEVDRPQR
jgi:O-methyltransferase